MKILLLFLLIPCVVHAQRFLLENEQIEFNTKDIKTLPGVFTRDITVEVNGEKLVVSEGLYESSRTFFSENLETGNAVMFSGAEEGAVLSKNKFYNIGQGGVLTPLDLSDLDLIDPEEELNPLGHVRPVQSGESKVTSFNEDQVIKFNPGCWSGDETPRELIIGVIVDRAFALAFGENPSLILKEVQKIVTSARLIIFMQLNVILSVGEVVIGGKSSPFPLNETSVQTFRSSDSLLSPLRRYMMERQRSDPRTRKASWHMLTNRWPSPGIVGMAYLGTLCMYEYNVGITSKLGADTTWYIWAHELGHSMGAYHSFENGQGRTGGIMDYGNYYYNGVVQFHPLKKAEMCPEFQSVLQCPYFNLAPLVKRCGDGVLNEEEECECLDGSVGCDGCVACSVSDRNTECSSETFVFRQKGQTSTMSVAASSLAQSGCCKGKRFVSVLDGQCPQEGGTCEFGQCQYRCDKFKIPACELINDGCLIPCKLYGNDCSIDLKTSAGQEISKVLDGVRCEGGGLCGNGKCLNSTSEAGPTKSPTKRPTRRRRRNRTAFPTRAPTTQSPTKSPTTKRPTQNPTEFPTWSPTCCECATAAPVTKRPTEVKSNETDVYEYYL
jgi:hypothetical protein